MNKELVILGILLSMAYFELTQLSPGGVIVPGYMILYIKSPEKIIYTIMIAFLSFLIVRFIGNFTILYGRRRYAIMILISFTIDYIFNALKLFPINSGIIGFLIPGIIALDFERQGILFTIFSMGIVICILVLIMMLLGQSVLF